MEQAPGGLVEGQRRPRAERLVEGADWYLAAEGVLDMVGTGDLSLEDLEAVRRDMAVQYGERALFVAVARPREIEQLLSNRLGTKRITWTERLGRPIAPRLRSIARGARLAVGREGVFWVDAERLFGDGEEAPLAWTSPLVSLPAMRPRRLRAHLEAAVGPSGPKKARLS